MKDNYLPLCASSWREGSEPGCADSSFNPGIWAEEGTKANKALIESEEPNRPPVSVPSFILNNENK